MNDINLHWRFEWTIISVNTIMNKKNQVERNIELAFDFIKKAIKNPAVLDKIEDNSNLNIANINRSVIMKRNIQKKNLTKINSLSHSK